MLHAYVCETCPVGMVVGEDIDPVHGAPPAWNMSGRTSCPICGKGFRYEGPQEEDAPAQTNGTGEQPVEEKPAKKRGRPRKAAAKQAEATGAREEEAQAQQEDTAEGGPYWDHGQP